MTVYYTVAIILNIAAAFIFRKSINITAMSLLPAFFAALMCFQAVIFRGERSESGFDTAYGSDLAPNEKDEMSYVISKCLFGTTVLMIPFALFLSSYLKLLSVLVYIIALVSGPVIYRIKNKSGIKTRISREEREKRDQEKKEELGKLK